MDYGAVNDSFAVLGFDIDSSPALTAYDRLERLVGVSDLAERSTTKLTTATSSWGAATERAVQQQQQMNQILQAVAQQQALVAQATNTMAGSLERAADAQAKLNAGITEAKSLIGNLATVYGDLGRAVEDTRKKIELTVEANDKVMRGQRELAAFQRQLRDELVKTARLRTEQGDGEDQIEKQRTEKKLAQLAIIREQLRRTWVEAEQGAERAFKDMEAPLEKAASSIATKIAAAFKAAKDTAFVSLGGQLAVEDTAPIINFSPDDETRLRALTDALEPLNQRLRDHAAAMEMVQRAYAAGKIGADKVGALVALTNKAQSGGLFDVTEDTKQAITGQKQQELADVTARLRDAENRLKEQREKQTASPFSSWGAFGRSLYQSPSDLAFNNRQTQEIKTDITGLTQRQRELNQEINEGEKYAEKFTEQFKADASYNQFLSTLGSTIKSLSDDLDPAGVKIKDFNDQISNFARLREEIQRNGGWFVADQKSAFINRSMIDDAKKTGKIWIGDRQFDFTNNTVNVEGKDYTLDPDQLERNNNTFRYGGVKRAVDQDMLAKMGEMSDAIKDNFAKTVIGSADRTYGLESDLEDFEKLIEAVKKLKYENGEAVADVEDLNRALEMQRDRVERLISPMKSVIEQLQLQAKAFKDDDGTVGAMDRQIAQRMAALDRIAKIRGDASWNTKDEDTGKTGRQEAEQALRDARQGQFDASMRQRELAVQQMRGQAEAYKNLGQGIDEVEDKYRVEVEVLRTSEDFRARIVEMVRKERDARRELAAAQHDLNIARQADDANRMAEAWTKGADAAHQAQIETRALTELQRENRVGDTKRLQELIDQYTRLDTAQRSATFGEFADTTARQTRNLAEQTAEMKRFGAVSEETLTRQKAELEALKYNIADRPRVIQLITEQADAQRALNRAQADANIQQEIEGLERKTKAYERGARAVREAALANQTIARVRTENATRDPDRIGVIAEQEFNKDLATRRAQFAEMAEQQKKVADLTAYEFSLLERQVPERQGLLALRQTEIELLEKGADLTDKNTRLYAEQAQKIAEVKAIIQENTQLAQDLANTIGRGLEDALISSTRKAFDIVKAGVEDIKRIVIRQTITKPMETWLTGSISKLMTGDVSGMLGANAPKADASGRDAFKQSILGTFSRQNPLPVEIVPGTSGASPNAGTTGSPALDSILAGLSGAASGSQPLSVDVKDSSGIRALVTEMAGKYGVPRDVALAVAQQESGFRQYDERGRVLRGTSGEYGVMQLMPFNTYGIDPTDPRQNVERGMQILAQLGKNFNGNWDSAIGGYNAGQAGIQRILNMGKRTGYMNEVAARRAAFMEGGGGDGAEVMGGAGGDVGLDSRATELMQQEIAARKASVESIEVQQRAMDKIGENAERMAAAQQQAAQASAAFAQTSVSAAQSMAIGVGSLMQSMLMVFGGGYTNGQGKVTASGAAASILSNPLANMLGSKAISWGMDKLGVGFGNGGISGFLDGTLGPALGFASPTSLGTPAAQLAAAFGDTSAAGASTGLLGGTTLSGAFGAAGAGSLGGMIGGMIGTATNSKAIGGLSGAALGAGASWAASALGFGAAGGPIGLAIGAIVGGVMGLLGTQKKSSNYGGAYYEVDSSGNFVSKGSGADSTVADKLPAIEQTVKTATEALSAVSKAGNLTLGGNVLLASATEKGEFTTKLGGWGGNVVSRSEDAAQIALDTLRYMAQHQGESGIPGLSGDANVMTALRNTKATDAQGMIKDLDYAAQFQDSIKAMTDQIGLEDQARKAGKQAAADLTKAIGEFRDKAKDLGLDVNAANDATRKWVDTLVSGADPKTYTTVEARVAQLNAQWKNMSDVLQAVGYSADQAATRVSEGLTNALNNLSGMYFNGDKNTVGSNGFNGTLNDLRGKSYLNTITDIEKQFRIDRRDQAALRGNAELADDAPAVEARDLRIRKMLLGMNQFERDNIVSDGATEGISADIARVRATLVRGKSPYEIRQAQARADIAGASTSAFANDADERRRKRELEDMERLTKQADEMNAALDDTTRAMVKQTQTLENQAVAAKRAKEDLDAFIKVMEGNAAIQARLMTATGDSRGATMLNFDVSAKKQIMDALTGGLDIGALTQTLGLERARTEAEAYRTDYLEAIDQQTRAINLQVQETERNTGWLVRLSTTMQDAAKSARLGDSSPLGTEAKLVEARRLFEQALSKFNDTSLPQAERERQAQLLQTYGQARMSLAKEFYGASDATDFTRVTSVWESIGGLTEDQVDQQRIQTEKLQDQLAELQRMRAQADTWGQRQVGSIDDLKTKSLEAFDKLKNSIDRIPPIDAKAYLYQSMRSVSNDQFGGIVDYARQTGDKAFYTDVLREADRRQLYQYLYSAPQGTQSQADILAGINRDALDQIGRQLGNPGGYTRDLNYKVIVDGLQKQFEGLISQAFADLDFSKYSMATLRDSAAAARTGGNWAAFQKILQTADARGDYSMAYSAPSDVYDMSTHLSSDQLNRIASLLGYNGGYSRGLNYWIQYNNTQGAFEDLIRKFASGQVMRTGGIVGAYADGGMIGNGVWDVDSVIARYAGGGNIALAGGEYVVPAPQTARYLPLLEQMRAGAYPTGNDNSSAAFQALCARMDALMALYQRMTQQLIDLTAALAQDNHEGHARTAEAIGSITDEARAA